MCVSGWCGCGGWEGGDSQPGWCGGCSFRPAQVGFPLVTDLGEWFTPGPSSCCTNKLGGDQHGRPLSLRVRRTPFIATSCAWGSLDSSAPAPRVVAKVGSSVLFPEVRALTGPGGCERGLCPADPTPNPVLSPQPRAAPAATQRCCWRSAPATSVSVLVLLPHAKSPAWAWEGLPVLALSLGRRRLRALGLEV